MPCIIALFLLLLSPIFQVAATAVSLEILIGPNNTLIFLIGEHHTHVNTHPGGNEAVIQKVLTILRNAEERPNAGFRLFIESGADQIFETHDDLLNKLIIHKESFTKNTFEDIEQLRSQPIAASHIFMYPVPSYFSIRLRPTAPDDAERHAEFRKKCLKRYHCDLSALTFTDLFDFYGKQVEIIRTKKNEWPCALRPQVDKRLKAVEESIEELQSFLSLHDITFSESIITEAVRLFRKGGAAYMYDKPSKDTGFFDVALNKQFKMAIDSVNNRLFDLMILDRILQACSEDSSQPIIVIAGDRHITELVDCFKGLGLPVLHRVRRAVGDESIKTEDLDVLEQSQAHFLALQSQLVRESSWCPCLLL